VSTASAPLDLIAAPRRSVWNSQVALWTGRALLAALVVLAWFIASRSTYLVPHIAPTITELVQAFSQGWILAPMEDTMKAVGGGFLIALAVGFTVGYALGRIRFLAMIFDPIIAGLFAVPRIVFYPVLLSIVGINTSSKLWLAALSGFFPIVLSTAAGIKAVNPVLGKLGRSLNCTRRQLAMKVYLPAAAPTIMTGVRIGFAACFISVIFAEFFATVQGLGLLVLNAYSLLELPRMYAVVLVITGIAAITNLILLGLERRIRSVAQ
jgi:NitT/TauT family transport system permease protein